MDGGEDRRHSEDEGIRRRRSLRLSQDGEINDDPQSGGARERAPNPRRSASDPQELTISNSSAVDAGPSSTTLPPSGPIPKVGFSEEIERPEQQRSREKTAGSLSERQSGETLDRVKNKERGKPSALALDMSKRGGAKILPDSHLTLSPTATALSPSSLSDHSSTSRGFPVSPSQRKRGYSLRRNLFTRSIDGQADRGSVIEMVTAGPSNVPDHHQVPERGGNDIKKSPLTVTVSVLPEYDPKYLPSHRTEKGRLHSVLPNYESWVQRKAAHTTVFERLRPLLARARKTILRIRDIPRSASRRHLDIDPFRKKTLTDERTGRTYVSNIIHSSRYTVWNFIPRQLFAQFSKLANFYFLCVAILQMIPNLSTTGTYTTIVPLLIFVGLSMAKEGYDDLRRYRLDKAENTSNTSVLRAYQASDGEMTPEHQGGTPNLVTTGPKLWIETRWSEVQVGDIVQVKRNEPVPADLVVLNSDGPDGIAYVETMALDGETNLKSKRACASIAKSCATLDGLTTCNAHIVVEDPNLDLYNFEGRATTAGETQALTNQEVIYRGSILRNTNEMIGLVIYSGEECKIRMNATKNPRVKAPSLQAKVNRIVIIVVLFVIALAIFNTAAYQIWASDVEKTAWYLIDAHVAFFPILASFIIIFNTLIPLSLYVDLEIIKLAQMFLMNDIDMYDPVSDTPMEARTSTINEELGQVTHIFSDKTGTLTDNSMQFRKISVAGIAWLHDLDLHGGRTVTERSDTHKGKSLKRETLARLPTQQFARRSTGQDYEVPLPASPETSGSTRAAKTNRWKSTARPFNAQPELSTIDLIRYIQQKPYTVFAKKARFFLLSLALCHTSTPEIGADEQISYQAASPDEISLVTAAKELGYVVVDRQAQTITLKTFPAGMDSEPVFEVYEILDVIDFSSQRKRMSIILRFPNGRICLLCKGADTTMINLLRASQLAKQKATELHRRESKRKSLEASQALRRNSEQLSRRDSGARASLALSRASFGSIQRPSMSGHRLQPIRDEVDAWLTSREREVAIPSVDDNHVYSPRPSAQFTGRLSLASSDVRYSTQEDDVPDLVDEALVVDEELVFERCFQHINDFAIEGLRTLLYCYRFLEEDEFSAWSKIYHDAKTSLDERQTRLENVGGMIERDFELIGATAIEDKLQSGVPEAIEKLRRADIKIWMLTGDKRETAITIGHSCRLIKDYSFITILDHEKGEVEQHVGAAIIQINTGNVAHSVVVVDGQTLSFIEESTLLSSLFLELAILADSVICCRASPSQKASLVKAIRKRVKKSVTLAIGDGANDIAMIQEAHVGIGITGKEGLQAARTSDYSVAQFRFLLKLLLVHGRWNYIRTSKYVLGTFWKEMLFYLTQALYQRSVGYSGTSLYESWSLTLFNTLFTSLPVLFLGVFEKDLLPSTLIAVPELYRKGQRNGGFNIWIYLGWMFMACSEAMIVYFVMLGLFGQALFTSDNSLYAMGVLTFTACVILISTKLQIFETHNKTIVTVIGMGLSIGGWFAWNLLLSLLYKDKGVYSVKDSFLQGFGDNALWWLVLILVLSACLVFEIGVSSLRSAWFPTDVDLFQEYEKDEAIRKRFEKAASSELQQGWSAGRSTGKTQKSRKQEGTDQYDRPIVMEEGRSSGDIARRSVSGRSASTLSATVVGTGNVPGDGSNVRQSRDFTELLSRQFGSIRNA